MGRADKEAWDTLWLAAGLVMDILTLDMVWVIVVLAVDINAEIRMLESMSMSQMAVSSRDKIVEFVGHIQQVANQVC
jgi:hypothetical protein